MERERRPSQAESAITAQDFIDRQSQLEDEAREALPYSFDTCTYGMGALRQPLYACKQCDPVDGETDRGAMCYACSISCHGEHELIELFNKRDFQCDCGTARLGRAPCHLRSERSEPRRANKYSHNFSGRFCSCDRVYAEDEDTMFQCLLCEDWFHEPCVNKDIARTQPGRVCPADQEFEHLVCLACVAKPGTSFILAYQGHAASFVAPRAPARSDEAQAGVKRAHDETCDGRDSSGDEPGGKRAALEEPSSIDAPAAEFGALADAAAPVRRATETGSPVRCKLAALQAANGSAPGAIPLFLKQDFRQDLCHCAECLERMRQVPPLLAEETTYEPPEDDASDSGSLLEAGIRQLDNMPRSQALEGVMAYNMLREKLSGFLRPYAEDGRVVTKEDVEQFFQEQQRK